MDIENLDKLDVELPREFDELPVFLVGGKVRDTIRGVSSSDTDLMVCEVSPDEMRERGFREIDSQNNETFGVFQDSRQREVALAREEVSTGDGHGDFEVTPVPADVRAREAIERDSQRRDFSINSLVYDIRHDVLHDVQNGLQDLEDGIIRAVNKDSFKTDSLRIIRGCRFTARLGFEIEPATKSLMTEAVDRLDSLPNERTRKEFERALVEADEPSRFFRVLDEVGALETTFPELAELTHVSAGPSPHHQEGSALEHTLMVLDEMKELRPDDEIALLMVLVHDVGKGKTPTESLPNHYGHGKVGVPIVESMAERLSMSNEQESAMKEACRFHMRLHDVDSLRESTIIEMSEQIDNPDRLIDLAVADSRGREPAGEFNRELTIERFDAAHQAVDEWTGQRLIEEGYDPDDIGGKEFGDLLHQKRVERMREIEA